MNIGDIYIHRSDLFKAEVVEVFETEKGLFVILEYNIGNTVKRIYRHIDEFDEKFKLISSVEPVEEMQYVVLEGTRARLSSFLTDEEVTVQRARTLINHVPLPSTRRQRVFTTRAVFE